MAQDFFHEVADKISQYEGILAEYLKMLAAQYGNYPDDDLQHLVITDQEHGHFQLTRTGWHDHRFYFMVLMHFDLKPDGKIWIQQNNTETLIAERLVEKGVSASDIVLGFRPEYMRPATGYAAA